MSAKFRPSIQRPVRIMYYTDGKKRKWAGRLLCSGCGAPLDFITDDEAAALKVGDYGCPLCQKCEETICPDCGFSFPTDKGKEELKRLGHCVFCEWERGQLYVPVGIWKMRLERLALLSSTTYLHGDTQEKQSDSIDNNLEGRKNEA